MLKVDYRYLAGFFDGEGSIGIYKNGQGKYYLRVQINQNVSKEVTELFTDITDEFGGNMSEHLNNKKNPFYSLQLNTRKAVKFLEAILPYLILKREQCIVALDWVKYRPKASRNIKGQYNTSSRLVDEETALLLKKLKQVKG